MNAKQFCAHNVNRGINGAVKTLKLTASLSLPLVAFNIGLRVNLFIKTYFCPFSQVKLEVFFSKCGGIDIEKTRVAKNNCSLTAGSC